MKQPSTPLSTDNLNRIARNRTGRLTISQWFDITIEPVITLLVLLLPLGVLLLPRLLMWGRSLWWLVLIVGLVVLIPVPFRAVRYMRMPLRYATLYGGRIPPLWAFWQPTVFYTPDGEALRFNKLLAPRQRIGRDTAYGVYYFEDAQHRVLLSWYPLEHADANHWQPTEAFEQRDGRLVYTK